MSADFDPTDPEALEQFFARRRGEPSPENPMVLEERQPQEIDEEFFDNEPVQIGIEHAGTTEGDRELNRILRQAGLNPERKPRTQKPKTEVRYIEPVITPFELDYADLCRSFDELVDGLGESQRRLRNTHMDLVQACNITKNRQVCKIEDSVRGQVWSLGGVRALMEKTRRYYCKKRPRGY